MKIVFSKLALLLVVAATLFTSGCNNSKPDLNCLQSINELEKKEFGSPQEALDNLDFFMSNYEKESSCQSCCGKATEMKKEFEKMKNYFSDIDNSSEPKDRYCKFLSMENSTIFPNSSYEAVRKTWKNYKQERKIHYQNERVDLIDGDDFKPYMLKYAKDLTKEELSGFLRFKKIDEEACEILSSPIPELSTIQVEGKNRRHYSCRVRVGVKGVVDGKNKGHYDYDVKGTLEVSNSGCDLVFSKGDYNLVETK